MIKSTQGSRNLLRGAGWLAIAVLGALLIGSGKLADYGINEYAARWLGAAFKVASGAWFGYRISRDVCRIDPSGVVDSTAFAILHIARALIVVGCIVGVTVAV